MRRKDQQPHDRDSDELAKAQLLEAQRLAVSSHGMVSSAHYLATAAGVEILKDGGNAIDAAVAVAFALGVCEPAASGIGGQSMLLIYDHDSGNIIALDGSSRAPHRVPPGEVEHEDLFRGHRATTVPSTPAVLAYALEYYGSLPLKRVLEPAIQLAEKGFPITQLLHDLTKRELPHLRAGKAAPFFLKEGKQLYSVGSRFRQPVLGQTLRHLSNNGVIDFYQGDIAKLIHDDMEKNDGYMRLDDLAQIPWPLERQPLQTKFNKQQIFTFGPPGAGRVLIEILNVLEQFSKVERDPDTPHGALLLAEAIQQAQLDRHDRPFDPHFYWQVSGTRMINPKYAEELAKDFRGRVTENHGETTHLSVMDRQGNVVGLTQSIERVFGSYTVCPELGFLYNNYMSAYEHHDITHPYYLRPNTPPWASVAPTIVFKHDLPYAVLGSPGSERIASAVAQVLLRLEKKPPFEAVEAPRLHCSINGVVTIEAPRMRDDIPEALRQHGFEISPRGSFSFYLGCVGLVLREEDQYIGVADPRRDGAAGGPHR